MPQTNTPELWSLCFVRTSWTGPDGFVAYFARDQKDADERKARMTEAMAREKHQREMRRPQGRAN